MSNRGAQRRRIARTRKMAWVGIWIGTLAFLGMVIWMISAATAQADTLDLSLGIPGSTDHRPGTCPYECNEDNSLVFLSYVRENAWGVSAASFLNSYDTPTQAFGLNYTFRLELPVVDAIEFRPAGGLMAGYTREQIALEGVCPGPDVCPFGVLSTTLMLTEHVGVTSILFGPDVTTWALRVRIPL